MHDHHASAFTVYAAAWGAGAVLDFATSSFGLQVATLLLAFGLRQLEAHLTERRELASGRRALVVENLRLHSEIERLKNKGGGVQG